MGEDSEFWAKVKEGNKKRKQNNLKSSLQMLENKGIEYKILNESCAHYRVGPWDFWPSTGKFYNQKTGEKGRGVFNLINKL